MVARGERAEDLSRPDDRARLDGRDERFVRRAQPVVVLHRHDAAASERSREDDRATPRRQHRLTDGAREVDAAVAWPERVVRRAERREQGRRQATAATRTPAPGACMPGAAGGGTGSARAAVPDGIARPTTATTHDCRPDRGS